MHLTGFVDDVRLPVAEAAVCVAPIRQGGGTRLKILEAMALGTPVVATSKGAEGLDVIDGEHLLLADDPETFAATRWHCWAIRTCAGAWPPTPAAWSNSATTGHAIGARFVGLVEETICLNRQYCYRTPIYEYDMTLSDTELRRTADYWSNESTWETTSGMYWLQLAAVQRRWNIKMSGSADVDWVDHALATHLAGRLPLARCLSLGCGAGRLERQLAALGGFRCL